MFYFQRSDISLGEDYHKHHCRVRMFVLFWVMLMLLMGGMYVNTNTFVRICTFCCDMCTWGKPCLQNHQIAYEDTVQTDYVLMWMKRSQQRLDFVLWFHALSQIPFLLLHKEYFGSNVNRLKNVTIQSWYSIPTADFRMDLMLESHCWSMICIMQHHREWPHWIGLWILFLTFWRKTKSIFTFS